MDGLVTCVDLNVLPLGPYDILIGMDWTGAHRANIDCYNKNFECLDEKGNLRVVKGFPKVISGRKSSAMQLKRFYGKIYRVYATHVLEAAENETSRLEDFQMLQEFRDVFPDDVPGLPPKRILILPLTLCQEQYQCLRHPTG